jgi:hypothetical protein
LQGVVMTPRIPFVLPTCMDLRRHFAHTTTGMEALRSGVRVHRRSFTRNLKMRF